MVADRLGTHLRSLDLDAEAMVPTVNDGKFALPSDWYRDSLDPRIAF